MFVSFFNIHSQIHICIHHINLNLQGMLNRWEGGCRKPHNPFGFNQHPEARKMQGSNIYVYYLSSITSELLVSPPQSCLKRCPKKLGETRSITTGQSITCQSLGVVDFPMELSVLMVDPRKLVVWGPHRCFGRGAAKKNNPFSFSGDPIGIQTTKRPKPPNFNLAEC